jgi:hypothetical protein
VAAPDGKLVIRKSGDGPDAQELASAIAQHLLKSGAAEILAPVYGSIAAAPQQP